MRSSRQLVALIVALWARSGIAAQRADSVALIRTMEAADWRFAAARSILPPPEAVQDDPLEWEDWIEYAYDGGTLRVYVSRGGDIIAVLADTTRRPYDDFSRLPPVEHYDVQVRASYVIVVPSRPVDRNLFDRLKSKDWTESELARLLRTPSYHWHVHGVGISGLEYVPEGLSFADDPKLWASQRYRLWLAPEAEWDDFSLPSAAHLEYSGYQVMRAKHRVRFARRLWQDRKRITKALAKGKPSPKGTFVVAPVLEGTFNDQQTAVMEKGKPEKRYPAEYFTDYSDYLWLDDRIILYRISDPTGESRFYTLNALNGTKALVATVPEDAAPHIGRVEFGVHSARRFWYITADGAKHEVNVTDPATPTQ